MTSRSKPSAMPLAGGISARAARNPRQSDRPRHKCASVPPFPPRSGGVGGVHRSIRQSHWRVRRRRHKVQTAPQTRIVLQISERRFARRIIHQDRRASVSEMWLDFRRKDLAEKIGPTVVCDDSACRMAARIVGKRTRSASGPLASPEDRCRHNGRKPRRRLRVRIPRTGRRSSAWPKLIRHPAAWPSREKPGAILDQPLVGRMGAIPFEHGEFGMMKSAPLTISERMRKGKDAFLARGEQFFGCKFWRAMQIKC